MFGVGDWEAVSLTDDQKVLLKEFVDCQRKFGNAMVRLADLNDVLIATPNAQNQQEVKDHLSMFMVPVQAELSDVVSRIVATAVDREKLSGIGQEFVSALKQRLMAKVFATLMTGGIASLQSGNFSLDIDAIRKFGEDNLREVAPMFLALALNAVDAPILFKVLETTGMPVDKIAEQLDNILNEGVPKGR
jgi:hypothetical protein